MKRFLRILLRIIIVLLVLMILAVAVAAGYFYYTRWAKDRDETITYSGDKRIITSKKLELEPTVTCLFMGVNGPLTDFIMLGKYDPNTREVNLISIPRDTYVEATYDHKINSAYARGYKPENTVEIVEKMTGVEIEYYVLFKTKVLRDLVDAVDGVTITVPFDMNYEDPYQNLYIHLKKGTQKLNGKKAEQYVRYRKGYSNADLGRIEAQQTFIKAMISRCLEPQNLVKVGTLVDIVLDNTKTNITTEIATKYIDDAVAFKSDRVRMETLPGAPSYINQISYFVHDKEATKALINEMFNKQATIEEVKQIIEEEEKEKESLPTIRTEFSGDVIKLEVLNNGASPTTFNKVVTKLNDSGYSVVRVGNIEDDDSSLSKITSFVASEEAQNEMNNISKLIGINKLESSMNSNEGIDFTIVLGPKYVAD